MKAHKHKWERLEYMRFEKGDTCYRYSYRCTICKKETTPKREYE